MYLDKTIYSAVTVHNSTIKYALLANAAKHSF